MTKRNLFLLIFLTVLISWLGLLTVLVIEKDAKHAYVDVSLLFENFNYTKELKAELATVKSARNNILDSLERELNELAHQVEIEGESNSSLMAKFRSKREYFLRQRKEFEEDNQALTEQYDEQIIRQINQYLKDYGEEHNYGFIYGAGADGNIMYSKTENNITEAVIEFINSKYEGMD